MMLKVDRKKIDHMEKNYPGIKAQILCFEKANLPICPHCGSQDTADVQCGIIGRTIHISAATTKFKLIIGPKPGGYFCNVCKQFFNFKGKNLKPMLTPRHLPSTRKKKRIMGKKSKKIFMVPFNASEKELYKLADLLITSQGKTGKKIKKGKK